MTALRTNQVLDRKVCYPGGILIKEGDTGDNAYFVQSGAFGVFKKTDSGEVLISTITHGTVVGEMALLEKSTRSATIRCLEEAVVITISRDTLAKRLATVDPVVRSLLEVALQRLRRSSEGYAQAQLLIQQHGAGDPKKDPPVPPEPAPARERIATQINLYNRLKIEIVTRFHPEFSKYPDGPINRSDVLRELIAIIAEIDRDQA